MTTPENPQTQVQVPVEKRPWHAPSLRQTELKHTTYTVVTEDGNCIPKPSE